MTDAAMFVVVALIWGGTNPLMRKGSAGIEDIKCGNSVSQFFAELKFMLTTWTYIVPFLLNQSGSLLYYLTLSTADMSLAVPVTNSLTMIFTTLTGKICGENIGNRQTYIGMALVAFGVVLCVIDKVR